MKQTVIGFFDQSSDAQHAVEQLLDNGFTQDNIDTTSAAVYNKQHNTDFELDNDEGEENGITRFFKNLFGNDDKDVDKYSRVAASADTIVTVHTDSMDEAEKASDILDDNGAVNVDDRYSSAGVDNDLNNDIDETAIIDEPSGEARFNDYSAVPSAGGVFNETATNADALRETDEVQDDLNREDTNNLMNNVDESDNKSIPIIEESFEVGKKKVQTGGVRLKSRIVERPVEEELRLRQEWVNIERNAVDRPATEAELAAFTDGEVEMIESAEVPVVTKQARVVEEIRLSKEVEEHSETVRDTVRKTEVNVEELRADNTSGNATNRTDN